MYGCPAVGQFDKPALATGVVRAAAMILAAATVGGALGLAVCAFWYASGL